MKLPTMSASRSSSVFPAPVRAEVGGLELAGSEASTTFWNCVRDTYYGGSNGVTNGYRFAFENRCPNGDLDCYVRNVEWISENMDPTEGFAMLNKCWPGDARGGGGGGWVAARPRT
ncbi:MAG TPA: hypothetical protein PKY30_12690 [Myxococcota bacterium]|nr:hypothetical protein [Myxococcota bacterium]HND33397.1 hypothetical protein [Myxococcota bacterium]HNH47893.1 hypothetical protein [Myxococcota bacterium]